MIFEMIHGPTVTLRKPLCFQLGFKNKTFQLIKKPASLLPVQVAVTRLYCRMHDERARAQLRAQVCNRARALSRWENAH